MMNKISAKGGGIPADMAAKAAEWFSVASEPAKEIGMTAAGGIGVGTLVSMLADRQDKEKRNIKDTIKLYQAIESPYADEESVIDEYTQGKKDLDKEGAVKPLNLNIPVYAASALVPGYLALSHFKNKKENEKIKAGREEVGQLRDLINDSYRKDMLDTYGLADEKELANMVEELKSRASMNKESMDKESASVADLISLTQPAAMTGAGALTLSGFLSMKNLADRTNPNRLQKKRYLDKLDKLYRERLVSPTIRELPFSDEELIALELFKQEAGRKKAPKVETSAPLDVIEETPKGSETVDMDDSNIQSIIKEL